METPATIKVLRNNPKYLVLYHCPCTDGALGALFAYLSLGKDETIYRGFNTRSTDKEHEDLLNFIQLGSFKTIYLIDYCGPNNFITHILDRDPIVNVVAIDHHKTAIEFYENSPVKKEKRALLYFDINKSGATLSLQFFKPKISDEFYNITRYVEDNDLWKHILPNSKEFSAGFMSLNLVLDYQINNKIFEQIMGLKCQDLINLGIVETKVKNEKIKVILEKKFIVTFKDGTQCYGVEFFDHTLTSEAGSKLATLSKNVGFAPLGAICARNKDNKMAISLRSVDDYDSTEIAKLYLGGGHKGASVFSVPIEDFVSMKEEIKITHI